jgi:hypothetical protein
MDSRKSDRLNSIYPQLHSLPNRRIERPMTDKDTPKVEPWMAKAAATIVDGEWTCFHADEKTVAIFAQIMAEAYHQHAASHVAQPDVKCIQCPHVRHSGPCAECLCTYYPEIHGSAASGGSTPPTKEELSKQVPKWFDRQCGWNDDTALEFARLMVKQYLEAASPDSTGPRVV